MKLVATMGDNCLDRYLPPLEREFVGGNALNVAVGLRDLGHDVAYAGAVGPDEAGRAVLGAARARGIDITHVQLNDAPTGVTTIRLTDDGDRVFESEVLGSSATFRPTGTALAEIGRRAGDRRAAELLELFQHHRILEREVDLLVEEIDDLLRSAVRHAEAEEGARLVAGHGVGNRRHVVR